MRADYRWVVLAGWLVWLLGPAVAAGAAVVEAEAVLGQPWGVGRLVVELGAADLPELLGADGLALSEKNGRVFYPAIHNPVAAALMKEFLAEGSPLTSGGPVREEVGGILRGLLSRPNRVTIHFLFRGSEPLDLTLSARQPISLVVRPQPVGGPSAAVGPRHERDLRLLLLAWWRDYTPPDRLLQHKPDYPPLVQTYLVNTLARRLNLRLPEHQIAESPEAQFVREVGLLVGTESIRAALEQDRLLGLVAFDLPAGEPLPPAIELAPLELPPPEKGVQIESIARHVPAECLYIRFGSFANFLWFQDTLDAWGGDLKNLVALRGLDDGRSERLQEQLVLRQSQLSRILGGTVISDVAMIGSDLLFQDGPAIGFLFEARNNMLLGSDFAEKRSERIKKGGVTEEKLKIAGQEVSYLHAPDGSVRSYYAVQGSYHFISTSKALVTRFLETADGRGSLGAAAEFRYARALMPLQRDDSVFIYFSDAFFQNLTSPRYRIEMLRRLQAATDIEVVMLAKLAAASEGKPGGTIEELVAGGMLPPGFGPRPDGSRAAITAGEVVDQLRGRRGLFLPVPDVPVEHVTQAEAQAFRRFADVYRDKWGRIEPITIALRHKSLAGGQEQVVVDVRMTPLDRRRVAMLQLWAGPADPQQLAAIPGNLAAFEAVLPSQRVFGGLRDVVPPLDIPGGSFFPWLKLRNTVIGYLGNKGQPGLLAVLDATFPPPAANGLAKNLVGLWRLASGPLVLYSFQPDVLAGTVPQLRFEAALRPAQLRLHVGDPAAARMTPFLNNLGYARTRQTALGNLRLLAALEEQLHVPAKDCKDAAELLLGAKLVCPLGGPYVLRDPRPSSMVPGAPPGGSGQRGGWTSAELEKLPNPSGGRVAAPPGYVAPPLSWFRGLDLDATLVDDTVTAHAEILMQMPTGK
ncbi:MAG: hypothetical protein ABSG86_04500 [Thermoguttaceae bacterium]